MAEATSPASGRRYGVARVCRAWAVPRSSFYADRKPGTGGTWPVASADGLHLPSLTIGPSTAAG